MTEHQDWNTEILNKTQDKKKVTKIHVSEQYSKMKKIENNDGDEGYHHEKVSLDLRMQIQKARLANNMKQSDLARHLCVPPKTITEYESGKAIPNPTLLVKMSKILHVKFTK